MYQVYIQWENSCVLAMPATRSPQNRWQPPPYHCYVCYSVTGKIQKVIVLCTQFISVFQLCTEVPCLPRTTVVGNSALSYYLTYCFIFLMLIFKKAFIFLGKKKANTSKTPRHTLPWRSGTCKMSKSTHVFYIRDGN